MNIGIVVHSFSGGHLEVAEQLKARLIRDGHLAVIERVRAVGEKQDTFAGFRLESLPDVGRYDGLVFLAPVRAFSLSPVMAEFLRQVPLQKSRKAAGFVGQFFPFAWMGGRQALSRLRELCALKGLDLSETAVVQWGRGKTSRLVKDWLERVSALFR